MASGDLLRIEGLTRSYGRHLAVDRLSFTLRRGEVFGLLGPNGAGKTTTIGMIVGLLAPDDGSLEFSVDPRWRVPRDAIGYCPQELVVWESLTCREQLVFLARMHRLGGGPARERADYLLTALGLRDQAGKLAKTLSGGMKRRLNIALALVHEPELLVLDEPQAGLDPQSRVLVRDFLASLRSSCTVLLTTHDMEEADRLADRVAIMDGGRILVLDDTEILKGQAGPSGSLEDLFIALTGRRLRE